jgi:D-3-phosphoglycerate dehydrogenase
MGIDVWEHEPPAPDNPLLSAPTAILSSHAAYLSVESFGEIRHKAFEETARVLRGEPPKNPVNQPVR